MKSIMRGFVLFAGVVLSLRLLPGCRHERTQADSADLLRIGAAELDITPPVGYRMAGYFDERLSTGVHDPLKAKALVLQQGREQIALVFCDLLGLSLKVSTNARAFASRQTGIPVAHIVISATHSHTGPLIPDGGARAGAYGGDLETAKRYRAELPRKIAESVERAESPGNARTPVAISYITTPKEKMSDRVSTFLPWACSGDI